MFPAHKYQITEGLSSHMILINLYMLLGNLKGKGKWMNHYFLICVTWNKNVIGKKC